MFNRAAFNTSSSFLDLSLYVRLWRSCVDRCAKVPHPTAAIAAAAAAAATATAAAAVAHNQGGAARLYEVSQMPLYTRPRAHEYYPWTEISAFLNDRPPLSLSAQRGTGYISTRQTPFPFLLILSSRAAAAPTLRSSHLLSSFSHVSFDFSSNYAYLSFPLFSDLFNW
uniref:Uncharacterized protein n=1 Tax=Trichogramma kaykai TaxID=54128 RepID=A0ABD2XN90_9HYME